MSAHDPSDPSPNRPPPSGPAPVSPRESIDRFEGTSLADLFANLPGTVWMTDERMVLTFVQGAIPRHINAAPSSLIGRSLPDLLLDGREDHPIIQGHLTALAGHETAVRIEWGGNIYNARIAPLKDAEGRVIGCVGLHQQIGWMPDDDNMLRESDIILRRVIDENIVGIAFGDGEGRITDANDAFLHMVGYTREELVADALSWPALTPIESHQRQIEALQEIVATGRVAPFENEIIRRDGRRLAVVVGAARLSAKRREGVAFVLDVSEHKRAVGRLRAELATADALAGAASLDDVGHDIARILCVDLDWDEASLWQTGEGGHLQLIARHGPPSGDDARIDALAERAAAGGRPLWSDVTPPPSLAVPLQVRDRCAGVLVLVTRQPGGPDADCVAASLAIAERMANFVARR